MSAYLRPTAPIAADVVLTGDPAAAMAIAQRLIVGPLMANHSYGLWGYSGETPAGETLTVQATGIGAASAATVLAELGAHGARRAIHVGFARSLQPRYEPGSAVIAGAALVGDGASRALGFELEVEPDPELTRGLRASVAGAADAVVLSSELPPTLAEAGPGEHAGVTDLQSAALFAVGRRNGIAVAATLIVTDPRFGELAGEPGDEALIELADRACGALVAGSAA